MASPPASGKPPEPPESRDPFQDNPFQTKREYRLEWLKRRRDKIAAEIERNRRGDYTVPTWALAALLAGFFLLWAGLIIFR
jgi:hypothetical protein